MKTMGFPGTAAARILIGLVSILNLQAAVLFILYPSSYTTGFEVSGVVGEKVVQGMGILFLMWNVPYVFAFINPVTHHTSLISAMIMQAIGVIGESILLTTLPLGHPILESTIRRFIAFDGFGLVALIIAWLITRSTVSYHKGTQ